MTDESYATIDEYISTRPKEVQETLQKIRQTIRAVVPNGEEAISYGIPTFSLNGKYVVYFAAWSNHIALYPIPRDDKDFLKELEPYVHAKGTLHFSLSKPIPYDVIKKVVQKLLDRNR